MLCLTQFGLWFAWEFLKQQLTFRKQVMNHFVENGYFLARWIRKASTNSCSSACKDGLGESMKRYTEESAESFTGQGTATDGMQTRDNCAGEGCIGLYSCPCFFFCWGAGGTLQNQAPTKRALYPMATGVCADKCVSICTFMLFLYRKGFTSYAG